MIDFDMATLMVAGLSGVGSGGVAWGITSATTKRTRKDLDDHISQDAVFHADAIDRLARIETKLDDLKKGQ